MRVPGGTNCPGIYRAVARQIPQERLPPFQRHERFSCSAIIVVSHAAQHRSRRVAARRHVWTSGVCRTLVRQTPKAKPPARKRQKRIVEPYLQPRFRIQRWFRRGRLVQLHPKSSGGFAFSRLSAAKSDRLLVPLTTGTAVDSRMPSYTHHRPWWMRVTAMRHQKMSVRTPP